MLLRLEKVLLRTLMLRIILRPQLFFVTFSQHLTPIDFLLNILLLYLFGMCFTFLGFLYC
jgi:hypothetical protein